MVLNWTKNWTIAVLMLLALPQLSQAVSANTTPIERSPQETEQLQRSQRQAQLQWQDQRSLEQVQRTLRQLEPGTVVFYPFLLDNRLELLLATATGEPVRRTVAIQQSEINQAIATFRQALQSPNTDARPSAKVLYNLLMQPIATDLAQARTKTILFAPDGALRSIPLAALHDGQRWLAERYAINTIVSMAFMDGSRSNRKPEFRVLAGAVSEAMPNVQIGDRQQSFPAMPFAKKEVEQLAALIPGTTLLLNQALTREALQQGMRDRTVLHLAANIILDPGQLDRSFILLGDGDRLTLNELQTWNLANLELVVLSACNITLSNADSKGEDILAMGYRFLRQGAKAVVSSLWLVDDRATQVLMERFYQNWVQGNVTQAAALQQAQIALIQGKEEAPNQGKSDISVEPLPATQRNFSHPYYWAPFILIGNGL
ncbi:MAG: CHAT domain-containing protein [Leptolyngbyaceae cyanobacterium bins.349]|nr:CHAT domain-containing protein [Leptolyngbyaceae cyanobacterium bins.349]